MKMEQLEYHSEQFHGKAELGERARWVLIFGDAALLCNHRIFDEIRDQYPKAYLMGCSTSGEIHDNRTSNHSLSITAIEFEKASIEFHSYSLLGNNQDSYDLGKRIILDVKKENLKHIFLLCEGVNLTGSKLVEGMRAAISNQIPITGGLAGDGTDFNKTYVISNCYAEENQIVVAALYGPVITGCASVGGWDTFGIERVVTKAKENILYEMNGKPALDLYKEYLGPKGEELPAGALLFPLSVRRKEEERGIVRTVRAVNEEDKSLTFGGDIPVNSYCKLMRSNYNSLINGVLKAAKLGKKMIGSDKIELAILVSCVGRKLVFKQRIDEEVEAVREIIGTESIVTGFYSYGEIAPYEKDTICEFHNQTMTVTFISEE